MACGSEPSPASDGLRCDPRLAARAEPISDPSRLIGGPASRGRIGDTLLSNDRVRIVIQQPGDHVGMVSQSGGLIIDADRQRAPGALGADAFGELGLLANLSGTLRTESVQIEAEGGPDAEAVVLTRGVYDLSGYVIPGLAVASTLGSDPFAGVDLDRPWPLRFELRYRLEPCDDAVRLELTVINEGLEDIPFLLAWFADGGMTKTFVPGATAFSRDAQVGNAARLLFEASAAQASLTYGIVPDDPAPSRFTVSVAGAQILAQRGTLVDLLGFPARAPLTIPAGGREQLAAHFVIGEDLDHAERIARELTGRGPCSPMLGVVREEGSGAPLAGVDVTALAPSDPRRALSNTLTDADGLFRFCLPSGSLRFIAGQPGRPYAGGGVLPQPIPFELPERVGAGAPMPAPTVPELELSLPQSARLRISVRGSDGAPMPARLTLLGIDPSPLDPLLDGDGYDPLAPGVLAMEDTHDGELNLRVEPGQVDLVLSRGIEYSLHREALSLAPGDDLRREITLHHVVDTAGFLSGDFHVHAALSPDSTVPHERRVVNMAAEGVEVVISTDHAFVTDFQPSIEGLGLSSELTSLAGQEITTFAYGHFGAFPLPFVGPPNGGAINWIGKDPAQIAEEVLGLAPGAIVQLNHGRAVPAPGNLSNFLTSIDLLFDAGGPRIGPEALTNASIRLPDTSRFLSPLFGAMEIVTFANVQGLSDWFNLLNAGFQLTATGNSDTHTRWVEGGGYARNMVFVGPGLDTLEAFDEEAFIGAVRGGQTSVALGAFLQATAALPDGSASAAMGGLLTLPTGEVEIHVRVQTPSWLRMEEITLYEGGLPVETLPIASTRIDADGASRLEGEVIFRRAPLADTYYVAVAR
ncbi:MAG: CehA/McbA family metallohydrolase, partial [Myxococcales bacterium]|nr:CehA/McbA family metallohydrolase [Myxococcales bacterium]